MLSFEEIAAILDACAGKPEREHLIRFIVIELGTAGRPEAVLELTDANIDLKRNLIDPRQPGRVHARKRRAIVPIAKAVRPWVEDIQGKLIKYKVPIAEKNRVPGGPTHFERETKSIKTTWNRSAMTPASKAPPRKRCGTRCSPGSRRGGIQQSSGRCLPAIVVRAQRRATTTTCRRAICGMRSAEIDAFFDELSKHTKAHLRYAGDTQLEPPLAA